ncbi:hypothetical protein Hanom_Chr06g00478581 [Helianthus anomalus]
MCVSVPVHFRIGTILLWTETITRYETSPSSVICATNVGFIYQMGSLTHQIRLLG